MEPIESTDLPMHGDDCHGIMQQFGTLYGSSRAMRGLYEKLKRVAPTDATVFVVGESGSGKERVATTIHQISPRAAQPFVAVNCSAIPANLI
ncbi:MAG TPA: sigma 54-interacting transcriptional regulator, partial [Burkholderiales bacterium]|nr:sigma 54-interacting transcriptional regulator [Burkholderiales bacterium]